MSRTTGHIIAHAILLAIGATNTVMHGMHYIKRARVVKSSHHIPTKKVVRHAHKLPCTPNAYKCCKLSLLRGGLSPDIFNMELNACCSRPTMARSLITELIERGEHAKIGAVLKTPLFNKAELDECENFAETLYNRNQNAGYVRVIEALKKYKQSSSSAPTCDGGYSKIISDDKSTKTHGENSSCCCDWEGDSL